MKRLVLLLTLALVFGSSPTFSETIVCHMDNVQNLVWGQLPGVFDFQITIDDITGEIVSTKGLFPHWLNQETGGWNTDDNAPLALNEQIYKTINTYDMQTIYFTSTVQAPGYGHWFRGQSALDGLMYSVGIREITFQGNTFYDPNTGTGQFMVGSLAVAEAYVFHAVSEIPTETWQGQMPYDDPDGLGPAPPLGPYAFDIEVAGDVITYGANFLQFGPDYVAFEGTRDELIDYTWSDQGTGYVVTIFDIYEDLDAVTGTLSGYVRVGPVGLEEYAADYHFTANKYELGDIDSDGISDDIDTLPNNYSNDFSDAATTSGTILDRGDQVVTVKNEPDPDGVVISAIEAPAPWQGQMPYDDPDGPGPAPPLGPYPFDIDVTGGVITYGANFLQFGPDYVGIEGTRDELIGYTWLDAGPGGTGLVIEIFDIHEELDEVTGTLTGYMRCGPTGSMVLSVDYHFTANAIVAGPWQGQVLDNDPVGIPPSLGPYEFDIDVAVGAITYGANFLQFGPDYVGIEGTRDDLIGYTWIDQGVQMEVTIFDVHEELDVVAGTLSGYVRVGPSENLSVDYHFTASATPLSTPANVSACEGSTIVTLNDGDEVLVTCGSADIEVINGPVQITFIADDGTTATTSLDTGNRLTFEPETLTVTAPSTNTDDAVIVVDGEEIVVAPGESVELDSTIIIDGCDTGVPNQLYEGSWISELIDECATSAKNHGKFVSCVAKLTNDIKKAGIITGKEKGAIQSCAAQADIP